MIFGRFLTPEVQVRQTLSVHFVLMITSLPRCVQLVYYILRPVSLED
jgi:hypothetical protein